jgi:hypothetical protein
LFSRPLHFTSSCLPPVMCLPLSSVDGGWASILLLLLPFHLDDSIPIRYFPTHVFFYSSFSIGDP